MKDKRFWFGLIATLVWLGFAAYMVSTQRHPENLNAWGDFFAGFFAPLAFLWLVLGYLQQGEELKHSTEALKLQAQELKNSVDQQSQLVAVTREQMNLELEALQEERELRRDTARPKFVAGRGTTTVSGGKATFNLWLTNVGSVATNVELVFDPPIEKPQHHLIPVFSNKLGQEIELRFSSTIESDAIIRYVDAAGLPGEVRFSVQATDANKLILGEIRRTL